MAMTIADCIARALRVVRVDWCTATGFRFQQGMQYTVCDDLGNCGLTVLGNPGTTYSLVEF